MRIAIWSACLAGCHISHPVAVAVTTEIAPAFVAFRDDIGGWRTVTPTGDPFDVTVDGPYEIVVVCDVGDGFPTTWRTAQTPDDDHAVYAPCFPSATAGHHVTGTMVQPGDVALGFGNMGGNTANWSFDFQLTPGRYDLVATTADHIAIRRGIAVADADEGITPPVDVVQQGVPLDPRPLTAMNVLSDDELHARVHFDTSSTYAIVYRGPLDQVGVVPQSLTVPSDRERVLVEAIDPSLTRGRTVVRELHAGSSTVFALPTAVPDVQLGLGDGGITASWSSLPDYDSFDFTVIQFGGDSNVFDDLTISASYVREAGAQSVVIDDTIPGLRPAWTLDPSLEYTRTFAGYSTTGDDTQSAYIFEDINAPAVRARSDREATAGWDRARSRRTGS